jgi:hypothetical protein
MKKPSPQKISAHTRVGIVCIAAAFAASDLVAVVGAGVLAVRCVVHVRVHIRNTAAACTALHLGRVMLASIIAIGRLVVVLQQAKKKKQKKPKNDKLLPVHSFFFS